MKTNRTAVRNNESIDDRAIDAMIGQTRPRIERAMKILRRPQARVGVIPSQLGRLMIAESDRGIAGIQRELDGPGALSSDPLELLDGRRDVEQR